MAVDSPPGMINPCRPSKSCAVRTVDATMGVPREGEAASRRRW